MTIAVDLGRKATTKQTMDLFAVLTPLNSFATLQNVLLSHVKHTSMQK